MTRTEDTVDPVEALSCRLPERAGLIRRRYWQDARFRTVCEDYRDAREALDRLEARMPPDTVEAAEYRELMAELVAEALDMLGDER